MNTTCAAVLPGRRSFLLLSIFALLALAASASAAVVDVDVVSDRMGTLPLYPVESSGERDTYRAYLEAERGDRYGIRISNRTGSRVGVVVAVDGRNIISGGRSHLGNNERMYVLAPYESAVYDGWRTSRDTINRFYFTNPGDSYAGAFGDFSAMGVVAVAVYREERPPPRRTHRERDPDGWTRDDRGKAGEPAPRGAEEGARGSLAPGRSGDSAGTGFGDETHSPSIRVRFRPESRAAERHFLKYEWRDSLCRMGIVDCRITRTRNRFWDDDGYAPCPPGRRGGRCE